MSKSKSNLLVSVFNALPIIFIGIFILLVFSNFFNLGFSKDVVESVLYLDDDIRELSSMPLAFYISPHGTALTLAHITHSIFKFNSFPYYLLNTTLRIISSISLYYLIYRVTRSRLYGIYAGILFGISIAGIEVTSWVTLLNVYIATSFLCAYLVYWVEFLLYPKFSKLVQVVILFFLTLYIYPARIYSILPMTVLMNTVFVFLNFRVRERTVRYYIFQVSAIVIGVFVLNNLTTSLSTVEVGTGGIRSPLILFKTIVDGSYPIVHSLVLFATNTVVPTGLLDLLVISKPFVYISMALAIQGLVLSLISGFIFTKTLKNNFKLSLLSLISAFIPISVFLSWDRVLDWKPGWIFSVQLGSFILIHGIIFLLIQFRDRESHIDISAHISRLNNGFYKEKLYRIILLGFIGLLILLINIIVPWLVGPTYRGVRGLHQSGFLFTSRYYYVASFGSSMFVGSLLIVSYEKLKNLYKKWNLKPLRTCLYCGIVTYCLVLLIANTFLVLQHPNKIKNTMLSNKEFEQLVLETKKYITEH